MQAERATRQARHENEEASDIHRSRQQQETADPEAHSPAVASVLTSGPLRSFPFHLLFLSSLLSVSLPVAGVPWCEHVRRGERGDGSQTQGLQRAQPRNGGTESKAESKGEGKKCGGGSQSSTEESRSGRCCSGGKDRGLAIIPFELHSHPRDRFSPPFASRRAAPVLAFHCSSIPLALIVRDMAT